MSAGLSTNVLGSSLSDFNMRTIVLLVLSLISLCIAQSGPRDYYGVDPRFRPDPARVANRRPGPFYRAPQRTAGREPTSRCYSELGQPQVGGGGGRSG